MLPNIGITCDFESGIDRRGSPAPRYVLLEAYVRAVNQCGAAAVLLPHQDPGGATALLATLRLDGVIISGGDADVPPAYFGQDARPGLGKILPERSAFERAVLLAALAQHLPILGICGGMQLLNVVLGGTLFQDLRERPGTAVHEQPAPKHLAHHRVILTPGSQLAQAYDNAATIDVNSTHHQIIDHPGRDVVVSGVAPDGAIEGIEYPSQGFCMGVQWHPECLPSSSWGVYRAFISAVKKL